MHICKICGKEFKTGGALGGHTACAHGKNNKKENHECPICNKKLYCSKGTLEGHIKSHDKEYVESRAKAISNGKKEFYNDKNRSTYARNYMSNFMKENNPMFKQEIKEKMVKSRKEYFENMTDEEYSKMVRNFINAPKKGNAVKHKGKYTPTKIEQIVIDFKIEGLEYNGNLKNSKTLRFKNKNYRHSITPDFIYKDDKKFIETFGIYWHPKEDEKLYKNAYEENGYKVLIIWEDKLNENPEYEKQRILNFLEE